MAITSQQIDIKGMAIGAKQTLQDWTVAKTKSFGAPISNTLKNLSEPLFDNAVTQATFGAGFEQDWRVKLSLPQGYESSEIMSILAPIGGFVFPYTPTITIQHSAAYQQLDPAHNNYPFQAYGNSKIDDMQISGDFYCENVTDAKYWIASVHYLRSVTKMHYGQSKNQGAPPPVVKLNGYGDYVFKDVPVIVRQFSVEMPNDVDYMATEIAPTNFDMIPGMPDMSQFETESKVSRVPVKSRFTVSVQPLYSREQVRQFSLDKFVKGDYVFDGKGFI
jgi:hypothetical protein